MSKFWKGDFEMKKGPVREDDSGKNFLELYGHLSGQGKEIAEILLKIGNSSILTEREFEILIWTLMGERL
jgi:hypothetical protein